MTQTKDPQTQRNLHAITRDGVFFSIMVGLGETYVPAFAIALGFGDVAAGLVATLPMLVGAGLQLVTPFAVRRLASYRRWVVACARLQAMSFLPLVIGGWLGTIDAFWIGVATVSYWAFGMSTGPAWNAWVTTLVPQGTREIFFAQRTRRGQIALLAALMSAGFALEAARRAQIESTAFALLFFGAMLARMVSAQYLASQSEAPDIISRQRIPEAAGVWQRLQAADSVRVLRYLLAMQVVTHIAAPYFTPYMLRHLALSYGDFMLLTAAAFVSRIAVLPLLGRMASRNGYRRLLWLGGIGIIPLPLFWLVSDAFLYLLAVQLVAGCAWAAVEFATTLSFFEGIHEEDRAAVLSGFNLANAFAIALGSLIGAGIMFQLEATPTLYFWLFGVSAAGRLLAAALLRSTPVPTALPHDMALRTLAVRPGGVAVQRPILPTLAGDFPENPLPSSRETERG